MLRLPSRARTGVIAFLTVTVVAIGGVAPAIATPPGWVRDIDDAIGGRDVSVAVAFHGDWLYRHAAWRRRAPASNQKLLLSMALLQRTSLAKRIRTEVFTKGATTAAGVLHGNVWIVGHGDPEVDAETMRSLAQAIDASGIVKVRGRVMGATTGFRRDWWAPGWQDYFPRDYIPLPTALTFAGNEAGGVHIRDPERRAARSLANRLRARGIRVTMEAGAGTPPEGLHRVATLLSAPFTVLLRHMNRHSRNFHAEVLGKWLGRFVSGGSGSIAKGARAIERFADAHGVGVAAYDSSGLSYANRVRPRDLVKLLRFVAKRPWGPRLRASLPTGDQGTLEDRLTGVKVRAKTGTLIDISALSGWVWLEQEGAWAEFSIMSRGMSKAAAVTIEDRIVRILTNRASLGGAAPST